MLVRCPRCGSALEVASDATEAACTSCRQSFSLMAEAETLTELPTAESTEARPVPRPQVRVNCFECNREFTIPLGETAATCPRCGAPYSMAEKPRPRADQEGTVPSARTVLTGAAAPPTRETTAETDAASLRWLQAHLGDQYEVIGFISRGGMGAVYRARQKQLGRDVALKVMLAGAFASPAHRKRFEREAQAVATLKHPAVVPVYEYGEVGGLPYFTMEFVEGVSLRRYVEQNRLSREEICRLMVRVCDAIHYAHTHGVVHRDLKPGNIMVDATGRPRILDFGLSRTSMQGGDRLTALTVTGDLMGTPHYMSPEQAGGKPRDVDERTDVYALGVILYELLVGVLPYPIEHARGLQVLDLLRAARPLKPSALHPAFPQDLEIILLKAIEKDKEQRYRSAEALAQDLENYLADRPISARPATATYRLNRWAWRNRKVLAPVALLSVVVAVLTAVYWHRVVGLVRTKSALEADQAKFMRFLGRAEHAPAGVDELMQADQWQDALALARFAPRFFPEEAGLDYLEPKVHRSAERRVSKALDALADTLKAQDYAKAKEQAGALTALAARMPYDDLRKSAGHPEAAFDEMCWQDLEATAESASTRDDALARIDRFIEGLPDSPHVAEAGVLRHQVATELPEHDFVRLQKAFERAVSAQDWPEAEQVVNSAGKVLAGGDLGGTEERRRAVAEWRRRVDAAIRASTAGRLHVTHVLKTPPGRGTEAGRVKCLAFSPDGEHLAVGAFNCTLTVWRTSDWTELRTSQMAASVRSVAFSADGRLLAAGLDDGTVAVQTFPDGRGVKSWALGTNWVTSLALSPDGALLLAASVKETMVWDVATGEQVKIKRVKGRSPAALSPDGRMLAAADEAGTVRLWDLKGYYQAGEFRSGGVPDVLAFSPDGSALAIVYNDHVGMLREAESGRILGRFMAGKMRVDAVAFSPDGRLLATVGMDHVVALWDAASAQPVRGLTEHATSVTSVAFSPDGRAMVTGGNDERTLVWEVAPAGAEPTASEPDSAGTPPAGLDEEAGAPATAG